MSPANESASCVEDGVFEVPTEWRLYHGGRLPRVRIAWRLMGPPGAPVVCAMGGIWCDRNLTDPCDPKRGAWCEIVGPGRPLNSDLWRILSFDYIGGRGESTGPQRGEVFPSISTYDQAEALCRLLDHLGFKSIKALVGGSYGGMVSLAFAENHPERVNSIVVVSAADRPHSMAIAWHSIQRHVVQFALESGRGREGLVLARAIGISLYRSPEEFAARFPTVARQIGNRFVFPVEPYLFSPVAGLDGFNPEAFLCLSESLDLHRVEASRIFVPATVVGAREDQLVPLTDVRALVARVGTANLHEISSIHGHDAYLREAAQLRNIFVDALGNGA